METSEQRGIVRAMALLAIEHAMDDGAAHGYTDEWTRQSISVHRCHAADHLARDIQENGEDPTDLEHALCRIAMALVRRAEKK